MRDVCLAVYIPPELVGYFFYTMAENKKSFVLYADLIHTVKKMPDDKAGQLLKIILSYVNDENPIVEDLLIDLVFEPIKRQMKRDLIKYENKKTQWSEAGKKSAEAKKLQKELNELNERSTESTDVDNRSTESTVTVNVNDTVTVNDINKDKSLFKDGTYKNNLEYFISQQLWKEQAAMALKLKNIAQVDYAIKEFFTEKEATMELLGKSENEIKSFFVHWTKIKMQKTELNKPIEEKPFIPSITIRR